MFNRNLIKVMFVVLVVLIVVAVFGYMFYGPQLQRTLFFTSARIELGEPLTCQNFPQLSKREQPEYMGYPGVANAPRWGIPQETSEIVRVRRSWTSLSDEEKQQFVDGILLLKQTTVSSGLPGAERANYLSLCPEGSSYEMNLYDYYAELHLSAFSTAGTISMDQMPHMGPHFLPWHRYLLLRMERDMQIVLNDPTFALPYWDWDDCEAGSEDGSVNPCPAIFDEALLGSHGGPDESNMNVTGYLIDKGFQVNIWKEPSPYETFNADGTFCGPRPLQRSVGTDATIQHQPPSSEIALNQGYEIALYDVAPYDGCTTDETQSFRQHLEGFRANEPFPCYIDGRCAPTHGMGHVYVSGDMTTSTTPNDPMFFLHHANVDRIWAMWQDNNMINGITADHGNPGFPDMWRVSLFNFPNVMVDEMFDFRALGYEYGD